MCVRKSASVQTKCFFRRAPLKKFIIVPKNSVHEQQKQAKQYTTTKTTTKTTNLTYTTISRSQYIPSSEVALSVKSGGEELVVESAGRCVGALVGRHSSDTILGLIGWQITSQLVGRDVGLARERKVGQKAFFSLLLVPCLPRGL